nr:immunoglobulin light chain junction region [Macaca mulatta]
CAVWDHSLSGYIV